MKQNATKNIGKMKSKEKKAVLPLPAKAGLFILSSQKANLPYRGGLCDSKPQKRQ